MAQDLNKHFSFENGFKGNDSEYPGEINVRTNIVIEQIGTVKEN